MTGPAYTIHTREAIAAALDALAARDPLIGRVRAVTGIPDPRRRPPGFEGLAQIVVGQQVSTASASAIWGRLRALADPFDAGAISALSDDDLRGAGLSRPKVRTLRAVAGAIETGALSLDTLGASATDEAHARLCAVSGIGPWTADIYLMFCLGDADVWPAGDLALQHVVADVLDRDRRPDAREMREIGERWRPARGAAALLFWAYYRHLRGRAGIV